MDLDGMLEQDVDILAVHCAVWMVLPIVPAT